MTADSDLRTRPFSLVEGAVFCVGCAVLVLPVLSWLDHAMLSGGVRRVLGDAMGLRTAGLAVAAGFAGLALAAMAGSGRIAAQARPAGGATSSVRSLAAIGAVGASLVIVFLYDLMVQESVPALQRRLSWILRYEGPVEDFAALVLAAAIALMGATIVRVRKLAPPRWRHVKISYLYIFTAFLLLVLAEELSWGQSLLNWESPEWFTTNNLQEETNLHNLVDSAHSKPYIRLAFYGILLGGLVIFVKGRTRNRETISPLTPDAVSVALLILAVTATRVHFEAAEFTVAVVAAWYAWLLFDRAAAQPAPDQ